MKRDRCFQPSCPRPPLFDAEQYFGGVLIASTPVCQEHAHFLRETLEDVGRAARSTRWVRMHLRLDSLPKSEASSDDDDELEPVVHHVVCGCEE